MEDRSDDLKGCFVNIKIMHLIHLFLKSKHFKCDFDNVIVTS